MYDRYVSKVCSVIGEQEFIELHASLYGEYVTEEELDTILKFLRSPIGKKDIRAAKMARRRATEVILKKHTQVEKDAYRRYSKELDRIISNKQKD